MTRGDGERRRRWKKGAVGPSGLAALLKPPEIGRRDHDVREIGHSYAPMDGLDQASAKG